MFSRSVYLIFLSVQRLGWQLFWKVNVNPLNAKLNPICHLLVLLGAHPILHVSRIRVKVAEEVSVSNVCYLYLATLYT